MSDRHVFPKRDDNSTEDAEKVVAWAHTFPGVDAHIVMDYITEGSVEHGNLRMVPGGLNGVTIQWDHDGDGNPDFAVHAPAGSTIVRTGDAFEVTFTMVREVPAPTADDADAIATVTSQVVRTVDGQTATVVAA